MKKILVTGGAGFIGSHLIRFLLRKEKDAEIVCLDNLFTGSKENIYDFIDNKRFEFLRGDIVQPIYIEVDEIYNLACPASPIHYQDNPIKTIKCNTVGMVNMLGLAKRCKAKILQASTSEVYGDPKQHPQKETYWGNVNCLGPRACYDEGKRVAETLCMDYHRQNKINVKIARIFNTYGPNMALDDGRVMSNFIVQSLQNKPITIYGDGSQTRSFCFVSDLIEGLYKLMQKGKGFTGPVNLGNPQEITIANLAKLIIKLTKSKSKIKYLPLPKNDPRQRRPDISLARKELSWQPCIDLHTGLLKTIAYFKTKIKL